MTTGTPEEPLLEELLFDALWENYVAITPCVQTIHRLLEDRGEELVHDHLAIRTFDRAGVSVSDLAAFFLELGYEETGVYAFTNKLVQARSYKHTTKNLPRLFISELIIDSLDPPNQLIVNQLLSHIDTEASPQSLLGAKRNWPPIAYDDYLTLHEASQYAAWVAAFGICANHFTISVNALDTFPNVLALNAFLKEHGLKLNDAGGEVKGSREVCLVQSSTQSMPTQWLFDDWETHAIPGGYYEFARRFQDPTTGQLFEGFVPESANRIFESTKG